MRLCAQHNLSESDPRHLDIENWVDYWASPKLDVIILTAGGHIATHRHDSDTVQFEIPSVEDYEVAALCKS